MMWLEYDRLVDAAYLRLSQAKVTTTRKLDENRIADYDSHGELVGVEFLNVTRGIDLTGLPQAPTLARLLEQHNLPVQTTAER